MKWTPERLKACFAAVDWRLSNIRVARALGTTPAKLVVLRRRLRAAGFDVPRAAWPARRVEPDTLVRAGLGRKSDAELAAAFGISRERVRQVRVRLGIELNREPGRRRRVRAVRRRFEEWRRRLVPRVREAARRGLSIARIARRVGACEDSVRRIATAHGIRIRMPIRMEQWAAGVDWTLTNADIAASFGISAGYADNLRCRLRARGYSIPYAPYRALRKRAAAARTSPSRAIAARIRLSWSPVSKLRSKARKAGRHA